MSLFTCVKETAEIIDGPKKGPWAGSAGSLRIQKAQNGEVLKASQKAKAMCKSRHPDWTKGWYLVVTIGYMHIQASGVYFKGKDINRMDRKLGKVK